jgi:hypothetical protein
MVQKGGPGTDSGHYLGTITKVTTVAHTRSETVQVGSTFVGAGAPTVDVNGSAQGWGLDAVGEELFFALTVPDSWDGASDIKVLVYWVNQSGDALVAGETVIFDYDYRVVDLQSDTNHAKSGTEATATATHTATGTPADGRVERTDISLAYNDVNQPYTYNQALGGNLHINASQTYTGKVIITGIQFAWTADKLALR